MTLESRYAAIQTLVHTAGNLDFSIGGWTISAGSLEEAMLLYAAAHMEIAAAEATAQLVEHPAEMLP